MGREDNTNQEGEITEENYFEVDNETLSKPKKKHEKMRDKIDTKIRKHDNIDTRKKKELQIKEWKLKVKISDSQICTLDSFQL